MTSPVLSAVQDTVISGPFVLAGLIALAAGVVSFASPCVVPLVPGYISYLAGTVGADTSAPAGGDALPAEVAEAASADTRSAGAGFADTGSAAAALPAVLVVRSSTAPVARPVAARPGPQWRTVGAAALFVAGFSFVFIAQSALVLGLYRTLLAKQDVLLQISGVVAILMGLVLMLPVLQREWRPGMRRVTTRRSGSSTLSEQASASGRLWGAPLLGAAFGTGWLACTSPTLAGIIALSATEWNGNSVRGLALVVLYCLGLGIPFLIIAFGFSWAGAALSFLRRHSRVIQMGGAITLMLIGVAMLTGLWGYVLAPLQGSVLVL